ncbi:Uncharacterised protein [Mycobacteroides abscessus subsp. abscessus]|nr:Uncharacterised protein [Mycobacteroides abscessus subsp. abscessus]
MASCCSLIALPNRALLLGTARISAPLSVDWRSALSKSTSQHVATPMLTPPAVTTPLPSPGTKYPARSAYSEKCAKKLRHGKYSPNGCTICLS